MVRPRHLRVSDGLREVVIPAEALEWQFARTSRPCDQHVNRTSSKAVLKFRVVESPHLPDDVRRRLVAREQSRLTTDGHLVISSQVHRDQPRNVAECLDKWTGGEEHKDAIDAMRYGTIGLIDRRPMAQMRLRTR